MSKPKVFGIGMHKTGTTTLAAALKELGYDVTGPFGVNDPEIGETMLDRALLLARQHEAFQDNPWPLLYRELDDAFPGSKFILTRRPTDEWLTSILRHFGGKSTSMREWIYGVGDPIGNEDRYRTIYDRHNQEVLDHFADRPGDLLVFEITKGAGWGELCAFLSVGQPPIPFPHANDHQNRRFDRRIQRRFRRVISRLGSR